MTADDFHITTERLLLRPWRLSDSADFAAMNAHPEVMADLGGPLTLEASDQKLERFRRSFDDHGFTRWVIEDGDGRFVGYCGTAWWDDDEHPVGPHHEIGWRLVRDAWGKGYASEAAQAALTDVFARKDVDRVLAYTASDNVRSQIVMERLGLRRDTSLDFERHYDDVGMWQALVWVATATEPAPTLINL